MSMKKRILSLLLAVVLCLSLLPTAALAEEGTGAVAEVTMNGAVSSYATLQEAFNAVGNCTESSIASVKLLADITLESGLTIRGGVFTLDLNGKTVNYRDVDANAVSMTGGTVTLTDHGTGNGTIGQKFVVNGGTLNVTGGNIAGSLVLGNPAGKISLSGGSFDSIQIDTPAEEKRGLADLLAEGYAFQKNGELQYLQSLTGESTIENVAVVKCTHPYISIGECPYCGSTVEMEEIKSITAVGDGTGNWLNGVSWWPDNASNHMTETSTGSGVYEITYTGVAAGNYKVKFVANDEWMPAWGAEFEAETAPLEGDATYSGSPIPFSVAKDNSTVKLVLDLSKLDRTTGDGVRYTITITPPSAAETSPVYVGGKQLLLNTKYVNDRSGSVTVSTDDTCNAIVTGNETDGYTLTLTDYKMTESCNNTAIILPDGTKLVLSGENTLYSKNGALIDAKGTLEISGTGSLTGWAGGEAALNAQGALTITDCKLDLINPSHEKTVICTNGNALTITGSADLSLHTEQSFGFGIKTGDGGNLTLDSNAKLTVSGATGILVGAGIPKKVATVKIAGTLDVSGCANRGANLLNVTLNMEGSSITAATKAKGGIYLYQNAAGTLTGETNIKAFVGNFDVTSPNASIVNYYKVQKDDTLGLYEEGSTVTFTAETIEGKPFASWTATGVMLTDSTNATISFTMPGNDVTLTTAYATLVNEVSLDKTELALTVGDTQTLTATITPDDANNKNVSWSSDKPSVATVDENGTVTAVAAGTANITVKTVDGEKTAVCAVTVTAKSSGGGSTGGGSFSYSVTTPGKTENGTVTVSPRSAEKGDSVTITVKPDSGYRLDDLTVTDKNGKELELTDKGNGKYTFTMPASKVEIKAAFVKEVETSPFSDVSTSAYYYEAVKWAQEKGITGGIGNGLFGPNQPCTRGQIVTFLWRAAGSPAPKSASMPFTDVPKGSYYEMAVLWAVENGITKGTSDTTFSPDATCSRAQIVTFLWRSQKSPAVGSLNPFTDVSANAYYTDAVLWAVEENITKGTTATTFSPDTDCTRAQIVTLLYRAYVK